MDKMTLQLQRYKLFSRRPSLICLSLALTHSCFVSTPSYAIPYGSPDARSIAMGGTGVATADNAYAGFFNPALLASYDQRKHRGGNQRIVFPALHAGATDSIGDLIDFEDQDYETQLTEGIDTFNNTQSATELLAVLNPLDDNLLQISGSPLAADIYTGLVITIPDKLEGGAFSLGRRLVMDGRVDYDSADVALVADYLEELEFVANGGAPQTLHPELYVGGALTDPTPNLVSRIDAAGLAIDELTFSMAWEIAPFDTPVMIGFTPKLWKVTTYEYTETATSTDVTQEGELDNGESLNLDLGYAQRLNPNLLVAVGLKNLIPREFETESGQTLEISPQLRIGSEYKTNWGTYAIDLDLLENKPLSRGDPSQVLAFGAEWPFGRMRLRAGLNTNLAASGDNSGFSYSAGVRLRLIGMFFDFSAATGASQQRASLQFGVQF
jgi:hypothetical protein